MTKEQIFDDILSREGGYVNHPADKGGPTNWGITEATARSHGYQGNMKDLTREQALAIYEADYWYGPHFDLIAEKSQDVAAKLCDAGVNMGPSTPIKWLQRWLNAFNNQQSYYSDISIDGIIGPRTIDAFTLFLDKRGMEGEIVMLKSLNCSQGARYLELAEQRSANEAFIYGWMKERIFL